MTHFLPSCNRRFMLFLSCAFCLHSGFAQSYQSLDALSNYRNPPANWQVVGEVTGTPTSTYLGAKPGAGILLCKPQNEGNLLSNFEHGDLELSLDVMLTKGSKSGVYLQGRYEIQVNDSWGITPPLQADAGGITQRFDPSRGKGLEGFEGHPPRTNAVKAAGLWNHIEISFIAPRFDATGKKRANARFAKVVWNGMVIHQNVELFGTTQGAISPNETAVGPLMLQGDEGMVAYKNVRITKFGNTSVSISGPVKYDIYEDAYTRAQRGAILDIPKVKDLTTLTPVKSGETELIDATVSRRGIQYYVFSGKFKVNKEDDYDFKGNWEGYANVWVDGVLVLSDATEPWYGLSFYEETLGKKHLTAGEHTFKIGYAHRDWERTVRAMAIFVKGTNDGWQPLHDKKSELEYSKTVLNEVQPTNQPVFQRSFVVFGNKKRTHAVNIGFPEGIHYSYDTKQGALLYAWRGGFLNTTAMWHERGEEQTAEPLGISVPLTGRFSLIQKEKLDSISETELRYEGMRIVPIKGQKTPQFSYTYQNTNITDWAQPTADKLGLQRTISASKPLSNMNVLLANAAVIQKVTDGLYAIDNAQYFIKLPVGTTPILMEKDGKTLLMVAFNGQTFTYDIVF